MKRRPREKTKKDHYRLSTSYVSETVLGALRRIQEVITIRILIYESECIQSF